MHLYIYVLVNVPEFYIGDKTDKGLQRKRRDENCGKKMGTPVQNIIDISRDLFMIT